MYLVIFCAINFSLVFLSRAKSPSFRFLGRMLKNSYFRVTKSVARWLHVNARVSYCDDMFLQTLTDMIEPVLLHRIAPYLWFCCTGNVIKLHRIAPYLWFCCTGNVIKLHRIAPYLWFCCTGNVIKMRTFTSGNTSSGSR